MTIGVLFVSNFLSHAGFNRGYAEELTDQLEARGLRVLRTSTKPGRATRAFDMLRATWRHRRAYDVAHVDVFSGPSFVWAEAVCAELQLLHKPFVLTLHGGNLPVFARRWPARVRRLLRGAAVVTTPSGYLRDAMRAYRSDLELQPNGLDVEAYSFVPRVRPRPALVWVRALHALYNPALAVDVLARVRREYPEATLTMLGPDKDGSEAHVRTRARELGVDDRVALLGRVGRDEVARHLAASDVFLNTTNVDNTPLSVLEAMASGLCITSTSVGGIPYLLDHEREALLVRPRDATAMAEAVLRLLSTPALAERLSRGARERARAHDWAPVLGRWESLFAEVADA